MDKGGFSDLKRKKKKAPPANIGEFAEGAKIDGTNTQTKAAQDKGLDPNERRGKRYKDPHTGEAVQLKGKVQEIPLNEYELTILTRAAKQSGLTLTTYIRTIAMKSAKKELMIIQEV